MRVNLRIFVVLISGYKTDEASKRHSRGGGNPGFSKASWTPAFAGVTLGGLCCIGEHFEGHEERHGGGWHEARMALVGIAFLQ
jgi:hypothetical protein